MRIRQKRKLEPLHGESDGKEFSLFKKRARRFYRHKHKPLYLACPGLPNKTISFTEKGWKHIANRSKDRKDMASRFGWLPFIPHVTINPTIIIPGKK